MLSPNTWADTDVHRYKDISPDLRADFSLIDSYSMRNISSESYNEDINISGGLLELEEEEESISEVRRCFYVKYTHM